MADQATYGHARLQRAVEDLLASHSRLLERNAAQATALEVQTRRVEVLEAEAEEHERSRVATRQRIDRLVESLDELETRMERAEAANVAEVAAPAGGAGV